MYPIKNVETSKREQNWIDQYERLRDYVQEHHHLPNKRKVDNRGLLNWWKYNRKLILQGKLDKERVRLLDELGQMRHLPKSPQPYADMFPEDGAKIRSCARMAGLVNALCRVGLRPGLHPVTCLYTPAPDASCDAYG